MIRVISAVCIASTAGAAFAQTTITVPDSFTTLQEALNPAVSGIAPGDIIVLRDTVNYIGTFDVNVANLTIRAAPGHSPVLDANLAGNVITVNIGNGDLTLEGLTIQDGKAANGDRGSGVFVVNAGTVTVRGCTVQNNSSSGNGGGLFASNTDIVVEDSIFRNNNASSGGGMLIHDNRDVTIRNTTFTNNSAVSGNGGGVDLDLGTDQTITIEDSSFIGNSCTSRGGGADLQDAGFLSITNTVFRENTAIQSADDDGGAMQIERIRSKTSIRGCEFDSNLASGTGGAVLSLLASNEPIEYIDTRFVGNESSSGTIAAFGGSNDFVNCEFVANSATRAGNENGDGGVIRFRQLNDNNRSFGRIYNSFFDSNIANRGGAIVIESRCTVDVLNSTFVNNVASVNGGAISAVATGVTARIYNNIFVGNEPSTDQVNITVANELEDASFNLFDADGLIGDGTNNLLNADPLFVDASNGDYSLLAGSPAIDAGNSDFYGFGPFSDLGGSLRAQDDPATGDLGVARIGVVIDMGAFEFNPADACPADFTNDGLLNFFDISAFITAFNNGCP